MTRPERDYDELLSRVLHSTLDPIEPAGDGLSKIQRRIAEPWLKRQWSLLRNELTALGWLIFVRCEPFLNKARSRLSAFAVSSSRRLRSTALALSAAVGRAASGRHQHGAGDDGPPSGLRRWLGPTVTWLRPALAVAGAVVIVVVGVFTLSNFHDTLFPTAGSFHNPSVTGSSHGANQNQPGSLGGGYSSSQPASPHHSSGSSPKGKPASKPQGGRNAATQAKSCTSHPTPTPDPSATATSTASPSPSPTPSATPSPTGSATPTSAPSASSPSQVDTSQHPGTTFTTGCR